MQVAVAVAFGQVAHQEARHLQHSEEDRVLYIHQMRRAVLLTEAAVVEELVMPSEAAEGPVLL